MEKLTVIITTYNLEEYIEQAVESILMQKVNFEYKIRISDDCSTDQTINKILALHDKFPEIIEVLLSPENQGSLKNSNKAFAGITSEYIAFLDGDDYWIGDNCLQKKVDFLDSHLEYTMCGGDTVMSYTDGKSKKMIGAVEDCTYNFQDYMCGNVPYVHTSAIVLRNCLYKNGLPQIYYDVEDTFENCALRGEEFRFITHLEKGDLMVFAEVMSCYRIHEKGIWQGASETRRIIETAITKNFYDKHYFFLKEGIFRRMCISSYRNLMRYLIDKQLYNAYFLTEEETYLLTEYMKDMARRKVTFPENKIHYICKQPHVSIIKRIWRTVRKNAVRMKK